jgi:CheY-like chemotaxis protein
MISILIVDDDASILCLIEAVLGGEGYHIESCTNGRDALRVLKEKQIDLVLYGQSVSKYDKLNE